MKNLVKKYSNHLASLIANKITSDITQIKDLNQPISFPAGPKKVPVVFVHNTYGQRVFLDPADYFICTHYLELLDWEDHLEEVYRDSFISGGTYLDIGGNIGLHVLRAHRLGASRVYAFEPNPNTFDILSLNMQLNGIFSGFFNLALGEKDGVVGMNILDYAAGMARIEEGAKNLLEVPIRMLNSFSIEHQNMISEKLSLVKIDVEGHEGEVINGAIDFLKGHSDFNIIIEFGSPSSVRAVQLLDQHFTFSFIKLYRWMQSPADVDMSFVNNENKRESGDLVLLGLRKK